MGLAGVGAAAAVASTAAGIGGQIAKSGAISAGQSQANSAIQQGIQTATNQLSPWATTGVTANTQEGGLLGLNGQPATDAAVSAFQNTPGGYNFDFQQGLRATDAEAQRPWGMLALAPPSRPSRRSARAWPTIRSTTTGTPPAAAFPATA